MFSQLKIQKNEELTNKLLLEALEADNASQLKQTIDTLKASKDQIESMLNELLYKACKKGKPKIIQILVEAGAIITSHDLYHAVKYGNLEIVKYLLAHGANLKEIYIEPYSLVAAKSGNVELLKFLITECGINIPEPYSYRSWRDMNFDLLLAAAESGKVEMMKYLVNTHKLDLVKYVTDDNSTNGYQDNSYQTILGKAIMSGSLELIHYLFEEMHLTPSNKSLINLKSDSAKFAGIKMNAYLNSLLTENQSDKSILLKISQGGLESCDIKTLFNLYNSNLLTKGSYSNYQEEIRARIESYSLSNETLGKLIFGDKQFSLDVLFYYSSYEYNDNFEKLTYLLKQGVDINHADKNGMTVVQNAVYSGGYNNITKYLVAHGANIDHPDNNGKTLINALGNLLGSSQESLLELLSKATDYTNSLKYACKNEHDSSLSTILEFSHGEIGNAKAEELLDQSIKARKTAELIAHVSDSIFKKMVIILTNKEFCQKHLLTELQVIELINFAKSKMKPTSEIANEQTNGMSIKPSIHINRMTMFTGAHDSKDEKPSILTVKSEPKPSL